MKRFRNGENWIENQDWPVIVFPWISIFQLSILAITETLMSDLILANDTEVFSFA